MDRTAPPPTGELLITSALLSLYVGLRSGAWAVGRLERAVSAAPPRAPSPAA
jgi:hypothetical protein